MGIIIPTDLISVLISLFDSPKNRRLSKPCSIYVQMMWMFQSGLLFIRECKITMVVMKMIAVSFVWRKISKFL